MQSSRLLGLFMTLFLAITSTQLGMSQSASQAASEVKPGTKFKAALESGLDARTSKLGQRVTARVEKDVKQKGRVVIHKGDQLVGHVISAEPGDTAEAGSSLGILFDQLVSGGSTSQLNVVLISVVSTPSEERAREQVTEQETTGAGPGGVGVGQRGPGGGGLGTRAGAGNPAGGPATREAGASPGTTGPVGREGNTGTSLSTPISAIRLRSESRPEQGTGITSVLSTKHGDLRLEQATRAEFRVAAAETDTK